jgi:hypothetical protein
MNPVDLKKDSEFLGYLNDYQFFNKGFAEWS